MKAFAVALVLSRTMPVTSTAEQKKASAAWLWVALRTTSTRLPSLSMARYRRCHCYEGGGRVSRDQCDRPGCGSLASKASSRYRSS